jgi:UDP-2-acetamido-2-deoxy-ribo-hexuluronate aminotransferase
MDTLQCAVVLAKLERFDWEVEQRKAIGARYKELFAAKVPVVSQRDDRTSVFAQFTVFVEDRQRMQEMLKNAGIPTAVHYPVPLNKQLAYNSVCGGDATPISGQIAKRVLSIPMSSDISNSDQESVVIALLSEIQND